MTIQATGHLQAKVMLVGEFPNEVDSRNGKPFIGGGGFELTKMMAEAKLYREQCYLTLVMKDLVPFNKVESIIATKKKDIGSNYILWQGKYVHPSVVAAVEKLKAEILQVKPNVVCTMGNLALFALTGEWSAQNWRSSVMESTLIPGLKVIPTLSPNVVLHTPKSRNLIVHDLKRVLRHQDKSEVISPNYNAVIRLNYADAVRILKELIAKAEVGELKLGADIETRAGHIACIAFAWSSKDSLCIPLMCREKSEGYWTEDEEAHLVHLMYVLMQEATIIGQNWNYDAQYILRHWHFTCPKVIDTMVMQHSCFNSLEKNLAFLSSMYLEDHLYWKDDRTDWKEGVDGGEDKFWLYNCTDAMRTFAIAEVLEHVVRSLGMEKVNTFQQALTHAVLKTMDKGIAVDHQERALFAVQLTEEIAQREQWMETVTGDKLNIKSPKQMADFFYRQMGQKPILNRKTHTVTCNDEALTKIAQREPILLPITRKIAELRSLGVFHSTFVQAPLDADGRIRTSFNVCGTEGYRFSSSKNAFGGGMNFQNIPSGGETVDEGLELPNVRKLFVPDPGHTFFDTDLDSADLRIVTWESDCKWMKEQFANKRKPYVEVMKEYFHNQSMTKDSHPREYGMFKALCHGTNYLGTPDGIAPRIGLLVHETERIQKWYFGLNPEIKAWQEEVKKQVTKRRFVENIFGYRMYFFESIEGTVFNQAVALIPQSTVACIINRVYMKVHNNLPEVDILLQVHDSLGGQFLTSKKEWVLKRLQEESQIVLPYTEPLVVPVGVKTSEKSWGDCHDHIHT